MLKITCCRKGRRRHAAPLKSRTLSPIHFLLRHSLILLNTIRSGITSFAAHLLFLLCVPTFALPEPQSACGALAKSKRVFGRSPNFGPNSGGRRRGGCAAPHPLAFRGAPPPRPRGGHIPTPALISRYDCVNVTSLWKSILLV